MRVIQASRFGGPDVLVPGVADEPSAGIGQVVVDVAVTPIDFVQTQFRRGFTPGPPLPEPPYVPGNGVAGEVVSVGPDVEPGWVGRRVVARTSDGLGGHAERAVVDVGALIPVPDELGLPEAAALLDDGSTALGLFDTAAVAAGEWVLVEAAAGGLGSLLVQLAGSAGARVIGAARGSAKRERAVTLGAELAVDYSRPGWGDEVLAATGGGGPHVVFDGVGGRIGQEAFAVTARGGRFSVHGAASGAATVIESERARRQGVTVIGLDQFGPRFQAGARDRARRALLEAAAGRLTPTIGQVMPLAQAEDAHAAMESRTVVGKTLLMV